ncbi:MAG: alpha/beta fold hydrolase [Bacilli bacterium]|nr:alpha/beta fold hydrolase [Bacilli bacterium]
MKAVLFIHGFSAHSEDNKYFIDQMQKYKDIDIYTFILPGHSDDKMTKVKHQEWLNKSEEEINKLLKNYEKITVVAHSMGCVIAVNLAAKYKEINKLVLLAPGFIFGNIKQNTEDLKKIIKKEIDVDLGTGFEGVLTKIKNIPITNYIQYRILSKNSRKEIDKVTCPTLIMHGNKDNVISIESSNYVYKKLKCKKELVIIKNARHQIFKSKRKKDITDYIYRYIKGGIIYYFIKRKEI